MAVFVFALTSGAQESRSSDANALRSAAQVFCGHVRSILRENGSVVITFHVDDGIKGVPSNTDYQWREWLGVWRSGPRYRVGQQLIVFLRPAGASGLTSPLRVLNVEGGRVSLLRRSARLGGARNGVSYTDYISALRSMQ
jgi:hypothetical protein